MYFTNQIFEIILRKPTKFPFDCRITRLCDIHTTLKNIYNWSVRIFSPHPVQKCMYILQIFLLFIPTSTVVESNRFSINLAVIWQDCSKWHVWHLYEIGFSSHEYEEGRVVHGLRSDHLLYLLILWSHQGDCFLLLDLKGSAANGYDFMHEMICNLCHKSSFFLGDSLLKTFGY